MSVLEEYKELYYKEIEYTARLNSKINTCVTFLTIIGSGNIFVWSKLGNAASGIYFWIYLILCIISSVLFIICSILFCKSYSGYEIHYYPIKEMALASKETFDLVANGQILKEQAEKHVINMMAERYLNDAIYNRAQNRLKNKRHRCLMQWVAINFLILLVDYVVSIIFDYVQ